RETERMAEQVRAEAAQHAAQMTQAVQALAAAATRLDQRATPDLAELEQTIVIAAFALAESIVGRELTTATDPGADAIARALAAVPSGGRVTVRLSPQDLATVAETEGLAGELAIGGRDVTVLADPALAPGDAMAECDATTVDARVLPAIARMREVLFGAGQ
ncbi:MAG: flagellar assembly protein, partial [Dactylosporangium sp.]|nr:flagellar assembly protein [Dactylosporangium sp.]NNJ60349.1 flagellar assembly protein [Dactylosporangium sp.]